MTLQIGDTAPDFTAETTEGTIRFHEWLGSSWCVLFSHPKDFTPVCTTELGYMAGLKDEFDKRNTKIIGLSVDSVDDHRRWKKDIAETQGHAVNYPMIGDTELKVATLYDMLPEGAGTTSEGRTAADNENRSPVSLGSTYKPNTQFWSRRSSTEKVPTPLEITLVPGMMRSLRIARSSVFSVFKLAPTLASNTNPQRHGLRTVP